LAFFWSAALPLIEALTFSHLGPQASRYGAIRLWGSLGFIVAVLGLGWLLERLPVSATLWVSLGMLFGILACAMVLPDKGHNRHEADRLPIADILRRREVKALFAACFFMAAAHGALYAFYSIHLVGRGYGPSMVGFLWTLGVVAEIIVFFYLPRLLRIFSLRSILLFSFACAVLRFLAIGWGAAWLALLIAAQLLHAATFGAYHAAAVAAVNRWFAGRHQARGQAIYGSVSFGAGGMLGSLASGWSWDLVGAEMSFTISAVFALAGLFVLWHGWRAAADQRPPGLSPQDSI
jgi:PPP family 3-phenylpropionic acid transporter